MAKYETPPPVRPLEKLITDFSYTNGLDPVNVFNDFLTYIIHGFSPGAPPLQSWKYKRQQNMKFMQMLTGWVRLMASRIKDDTSWYDPFGDLYMALVSKSAQQSQGQFFTPVHICDLMVLCTQTEEKKTGQRMGDPTLMGACSPLYAGTQTALMQEQIPPEYLGRVFGLYGTIMAWAMPMGLAAPSVFADLLGAPLWFVGSGATMVLLAMAMLLAPSVRNVGKRDTGRIQ